MSLGEWVFILYLAFCIALAAFGFMRIGNPHRIGRWLAHRRAGHQHRYSRKGR